jgi:hypothetical protein
MSNTDYYIATHQRRPNTNLKPFEVASRRTQTRRIAALDTQITALMRRRTKLSDRNFTVHVTIAHTHTSMLTMSHTHIYTHSHTHTRIYSR